MTSIVHFDSPNAGGTHGPLCPSESWQTDALTASPRKVTCRSCIEILRSPPFQVGLGSADYRGTRPVAACAYCGSERVSPSRSSCANCGAPRADVAVSQPTQTLTGATLNPGTR